MLPRKYMIWSSTTCLSGNINPMTVPAWAPGSPSPYRNRQATPCLPSCTVSPSRRPHNDISFPVDSCVSPPFMKRPFLLLLLHGLTAAGDRPFSAAGYNVLSAALRANVSLSCLICHTSFLLAEYNITQTFYSSISFRSAAMSSFGSVTD
jgi:hypothetical protein